LLAACDPYTRLIGESSAGAVDPVDFPAAYLGGGDAKMPGGGRIDPIVAYALGTELGYYSFPYDGDLSLATEGVLSIPLSYDFDVTSTAKCLPPANYVYDQQRDAVRFDQQGDIFVQLPDADGYIPAVADVTVEPDGLHCQDTKSEANVVDRTDVQLALVPAKNPTLPDAHPTGMPSGKFLARAIIDPSIDVRGPIGYYSPGDPGGSVDPNTGLGPQKWGWYQRYLVAYIDGGAIPVLDREVMNATGQAQRVTQIVPMSLYFPSMRPGLDGQGNPVPVAGMPGDGFDVVDAVRGMPNYSPLCQVFSFDPANPMLPERNVGDIDQSTVQPTGMFVWCMQVAK
jgi:hypothetical protein